MMKNLNAYQKAARLEALTPEEREARILKHVPMVKRIATRIGMRLPPHAETEDLYSAGIIGLIDAVEKYDPSKGVPFEAYAEYRIRGAVFDELRSLDPTPRSVRTMARKIEETYEALESKLGREPEDEEMARALGMATEDYLKYLMQVNGTVTISLNELIGNQVGTEQRQLIDSLTDPDDKTALNRIELEELKGVLIRSIDELPEKYRLVLSLYYFEDMNMKEVGEALGVTESRVSQIHSKCMMALKKKINAAMNGIS